MRKSSPWELLQPLTWDKNYECIENLFQGIEKPEELLMTSWDQRDKLEVNLLRKPGFEWKGSKEWEGPEK